MIAENMTSHRERQSLRCLQSEPSMKLYFDENLTSSEISFDYHPS